MILFSGDKIVAINYHRHYRMHFKNCSPQYENNSLQCFSIGALGYEFVGEMLDRYVVPLQQSLLVGFLRHVNYIYLLVAHDNECGERSTKITRQIVRAVYLRCPMRSAETTAD